MADVQYWQENVNKNVTRKTMLAVPFLSPDSCLQMGLYAALGPEGRIKPQQPLRIR